MQSVRIRLTDSCHEYTQFTSWELLSSCTAIIFYCDATREDSCERGFSDHVQEPIKFDGLLPRIIS